MINKSALILLCGLILLTLSACLAQVELEQAVQTVDPVTSTAVATHTTSIETIVTAPILEPVTPLPTPTTAEEPIMPVDPTDPPKGHQTRQPPAEPTLHPAIQEWVIQAKEELAQRLKISNAEIELLSFEAKVWPDAGLGCPQPGMGYAQVTVEGYLIRLQAADQIYNYHGGGGSPPFLCEQPGPKIVISKQAPLNIKQTPTKSIPPPRD